MIIGKLISSSVKNKVRKIKMYFKLLMGTTFSKLRQTYFMHCFVHLFNKYLGASYVAGNLDPGNIV